MTRVRRLQKRKAAGPGPCSGLAAASRRVDSQTVFYKYGFLFIAGGTRSSAIPSFPWRAFFASVQVVVIWFVALRNCGVA